MKPYSPIAYILCALLGTLACDSQNLLLGAHEPDADAQVALSDASVPPAMRTPLSPLEPFLALAGDGSQAYRKIANLWCDRLQQCEADANQAASWADHATCVEEVVREFPLHRDTNESEIACDGNGDVTITPLALATCLRAFHDASCLRVSRRGFWSLVMLANYGFLADCVAAAEETVQQCDMQHHALPIGSPCRRNGLRNLCGDHAYCHAAEVGACGVCRALPSEGELCAIQGNLIGCRVGYDCRDGVCRRNHVGEGERCIAGRCALGLDCDEDDRCFELHRVGDPCSVGSCGTHLQCVDGLCAYVPLVHTKLGAPCEPDSWDSCGSGYCRNGRCAELPRLGEPCAEVVPNGRPICLAPFACVAGRCAEAPRCGEGNDSPCHATWQCAAGQLCAITSLDDLETRCTSITSKAGESCDHHVACEEGSCVNGRCALPAGSACSQDQQCTTLLCVDGVCASASCGG